MWKVCHKEFVNRKGLHKSTFPHRQYQSAAQGLVQGRHIVEENPPLVRWHVEKFNVCTCFSHRLREDRSAKIKPCLCESVVKRWCGVSCPSSNEILVMLDLLGISEWQIAEAMVEACHLSSSRTSMGSRTWYDILSASVKSVTRFEDGE